MRRSRAVHLEHLQEALRAVPGRPGPPLVYLPYLFMRSHGLRATRQIAAALSAELEN